jgi:hypothetical protein
LKTSKIKPIPKDRPQPVKDAPAAPPQDPLSKFPVLHERHPYLKIVWGDILSVLNMIRRKPQPEKYDPLSAAHERSRRGF